MIYRTLIIFFIFFMFSYAQANNTKNLFLQQTEIISKEEWSLNKARHLLERAGFGGNQKEIKALFDLGHIKAVNKLVNYEEISIETLKPFDESKIYDPGLKDFPSSRPETIRLAEKHGEALGVKVKKSGNRKMQPIVNKFFFWLRASKLETKRVSYWWANRMLNSPRPLEETMTLFWHNHFANSEAKIRDYRKILLQNETFRKNATGNFKNLLVAVAKDPAMLYYLDAGKNTKGSPNENFSREIMELFTLGVGNYSEKDIREAARAFTGWNSNDLEFVINKRQHDFEKKTIFSQTANFSGEEVIDLLFSKEATSVFIVKKIYKEFVNENLSNDFVEKYAKVFRSNNYELKPLLKAIFLSKHFYQEQNVASHIKSPVELVISTYKKFELEEIPGIPDFNEVTSEMGQTLFWPPTVAGWAGGRSWITPALLMERGNFANNLLNPDIKFIPKDFYSPDSKIIIMHEALKKGKDITSATKLSNGGESIMIAESNMMADRSEDFNTRYGSYRGWQMAIEKVKSIPRNSADINLSKMVIESGATNVSETVDFFLNRFLLNIPNKEIRSLLIKFLKENLGSNSILESKSFLEGPLRKLVHIIMSQPEYQLG